MTDDGRGFDPTHVPAGHMGLGTMSQRAAALREASLRCSAVQAGEGTAITVHIPVEPWRRTSDQ